jgi:hypothetical protein
MPNCAQRPRAFRPSASSNPDQLAEPTPALGLCTGTRCALRRALSVRVRGGRREPRDIGFAGRRPLVAALTRGENTRTCVAAPNSRSCTVAAWLAGPTPTTTETTTAATATANPSATRATRPERAAWMMALMAWPIRGWLIRGCRNGRGCGWRRSLTRCWSNWSNGKPNAVDSTPDVPNCWSRRIVRRCVTLNTATRPPGGLRRRRNSGRGRRGCWYGRHAAWSSSSPTSTPRCPR